MGVASGAETLSGQVRFTQALVIHVVKACERDLLIGEFTSECAQSACQFPTCQGTEWAIFKSCSSAITGCQALHFAMG